MTVTHLLQDLGITLRRGKVDSTQPGKGSIENADLFFHQSNQRRDDKLKRLINVLSTASVRVCVPRVEEKIVHHGNAPEA